MATAKLEAYRAAWQEKPALRAIYRDYYRRMAARARLGRTLEIGGGSGWLRERLPDVVLSDIQPAPWLDLAADAQALPFRDASFDNIVMLDVLHHIERPVRFFAEAARVLKPGGRIVMIEPAITPLSRLVFWLFHDEPVDLKADPWLDAPPSKARDPYEANQAIPSLLFERGRARFEQRCPALAVREVHHLSLFAYPLTGGFRRFSAIPAALVAPLLRLEDALLPLLGRLMAFRLLVALERGA